MAGPTFLTVVLTLTFFVGFSSCQTVNTTCPTVYDPNENYFPSAFTNESFALPINMVTVKTAEQYTVAYNRSYKILQSNLKKEVYVLYQCGTPKPDVSLPTAAPKFFEVPLVKVAIDATVSVTFLALLGVTDRIRRADLTYAVAPCLQKLKEDGQILTFNASSPQQVDSMSGVLTASGMPLSQLAALPKYIDFDSSTFDKGPLKRAEWIKYAATLFNKEALATRVYDTIEQSYNCQAAVYSAATTKPTVAWISEQMPGTFKIDDTPYKLQFTNDAGGVSLDKTLLMDYNLSNPTELAAFHRALKFVDIVIDETYFSVAPDYNMSVFTSSAKIAPEMAVDFKFLVNKQVWRSDRILSPAPTFSWAWFEGAVAEPHVVLSEMAHIINPTVTRTPTYFRNFAAGDPIVIQTAADCPSAYTTPQVTVIPCPVATTAPPAAAPTPPKGAASASNVAIFFVMALSTFATFIVGSS